MRETITRDALLRAVASSTIDQAFEALGYNPQSRLETNRQKLRRECKRHGIAYPFARVFKTYTREQLERVFAAHDNAHDAAMACGVPIARDGWPLVCAIKQAAQRYGIPWPYTARVGRRTYRPDAPEALGLVEPRPARR